MTKRSDRPFVLPPMLGNPAATPRLRRPRNGPRHRPHTRLGRWLFRVWYGWAP